MFIEYCAAVDVLFVCFCHRSGTRFGSEDSFVTIGLELWQKEAVKLLRLYFLYTQTCCKICF